MGAHQLTVRLHSDWPKILHSNTVIQQYTKGKATESTKKRLQLHCKYKTASLPFCSSLSYFHFIKPQEAILLMKNYSGVLLD